MQYVLLAILVGDLEGKSSDFFEILPYLSQVIATYLLYMLLD